MAYPRRSPAIEMQLLSSRMKTLAEHASLGTGDSKQKALISDSEFVAAINAANIRIEHLILGEPA